MNPKNWSLNSYTAATWTDLVAEPAVLATVVIGNVSAGDVSVSLRIEDGGTGLATVLPTATIPYSSSYTLDVRSLNLTGSQKLQVQADVAGAEFFASGVIAS